jgi:phage gp36-like protein
MAYATQSDMVPLRLTQTELVQLTCDDATNTVNAATVTAALEEASGVVDSYCRQRYQTPLQPSDDVKGKTLDIAVWLLFRRRRNGKNGEIIRQAYEDAIAFLTQVSTGKATLDQPAGSAPQTADSSVEKSTKRLIFDEHNLKGFV